MDPELLVTLVTFLGTALGIVAYLHRSISGLEDRLTTRIDQVGQSLGARIDQLDARIDRLEGRIDHLEMRIESRFAILESRFTALESRIYDLATRGPAAPPRAG